MHCCKSIAFGNKINYIGVLGSELSTIEAFGLATVLNSSFMDKYFRCISGNTQVNATETRVMKFPDRDQIKEIGDRVHKLKLFETAIIDSIVNPVLGVVDSM
jgi:adenine-specific DNA-methyltransferase